MKINLGLIWTMLTSTVLAVVYMFSTFASAADVERIEYQILKQTIRDVRKELRSDPNNQYLLEDLQDAIDALCLIVPTDRECKGDN
jgi:hypothetical protein